MAKNLVQKGHDVVAFDVCQDEVCIPLKRGLGDMADKLTQVGSPSEVASQTRVIMFILVLRKHTWKFASYLNTIRVFKIFIIV